MSSYISPEIRRVVASRVGFVCEYCLIAEEDSYFRFQVEHIISRKHGGSSELENLALACVFCNRYKGSDIASLTPKTSELIHFYNPRTMRWREHFRLNGVVIEPLTEIGEATVRILQMNHDNQILEREVLIRHRHYPSQAALLLITEH
ncbi:MAG: HNH endonuclease [Acidobacteriota bacterium]|nr:HNH endonuclease [Acidobacteriota bacterium]